MPAKNETLLRNTSDTPQIAVIMPCYNPRLEELQLSLDSLAAQTVPFRLIVVDDGSWPRPNYEKLLKPFDHDLIQLPSNVGVCLVRNPAIHSALTQGYKYIAIFDCGDWMAPEKLALQQQFFEQNRDISILGTNSSICDENMNHLYDFNPHLENSKIQKSLYYGLAFKHPSMMFKAEVFRKIGFYTDRFPAAEDYDLLRRAAPHFKCANLAEVLLRKVESLSSITNTQRNDQIVSRLKIQWHYRELDRIECYLGLCKTLLSYILPVSLNDWTKSIIYRRPTQTPVTILAEAVPEDDVAKDVKVSTGRTNASKR